MFMIFITPHRKASFASIVYAMGSISIRLSVRPYVCHTLALCQNKGMQKDAVFTTVTPKSFIFSTLSKLHMPPIAFSPYVLFCAIPLVSRAVLLISCAVSLGPPVVLHRHR